MPYVLLTQFVRRVLTAEPWHSFSHRVRSHMWVELDQRKYDEKAILFRINSDAERQVDMGYLTPCLLAVIDTRLYCGMRGGVNATFGCTGEGKSSNQPEAIEAHDKFLRERVIFHYV